MKNPFWLLKYMRRGPITHEQLDISPETARAAVDRFNKAYPGLARLVEQRRREERVQDLPDVQNDS